MMMTISHIDYISCLPSIYIPDDVFQWIMFTITILQYDHTIIMIANRTELYETSQYKG